MHTTEPGAVLFTPDGNARVIDIETTTDRKEQLRILAGEMGCENPTILAVKGGHLVLDSTRTEPNPVLMGVLSVWLMWHPQIMGHLTGPVVLTGNYAEDDPGPLTNIRVDKLHRVHDLWQQSRAALL